MKSRFTHLVLENWRNFRAVDVDLGERVFVVGPNAAGKTNLLDAIRFLSDIARPEGSLVQAVKARGGIAHLRSLHARQASNVRVQATMLVGENTWTYDLVLSGHGNSVLIESERVEKNGKILFTRPNEADKADPRRRQQTHLQQITQNAAFRELADALAKVVHVHIVPQVAKSNLRSGEVALRDAPGSDFIDQLALLSEKKQRGVLNRLERLLKIAVPQFSELHVKRDDLGRPHLQAKYRHWRPHGSWQNESEFSDGTLRLIGLLWAILSDDSPLLLEEPELSLHRDVVRQIPRLISRAALHNERQVIVSSHAEELLNDAGIGPGEILVLTPTDQDTHVAPASEDKALLAAAKSRVPLGPLITGRTRPKGIEQLSFQIVEPSRR